jgi:RNA polymerase sigma-70 factor (ECF subfamily)
MNPSDEELMQALAAHDDTAAYEELVQRFQGRLFHFILRRVGDRGVAEDLVQETLLRLWQKRHAFRHGSRLSTWLFAIGLNLCRDYWRRSRPESSLDRPEVALAAEHSSLRPPGEDPLRQAENAEVTEALLAALELLPPTSAALLRRRSSEDLTLEEAGSSLGLSPAAARAAAARAYKKLRLLLKKDRRAS